MPEDLQTDDPSNPLRQLPSVDRLLGGESGAALEATYGHGLAVEGLRHALEKARERLQNGDERPPSDEALTQKASRYLSNLLAPTLRRVVNATGVVVHTNLGAYVNQNHGFQLKKLHPHQKEGPS